MSDNEVFWCNLLVCTVFEVSILGFFVRARYWRQICWRVLGSLACVAKVLPAVESMLGVLLHTGFAFTCSNPAIQQ